MGAASSTAVLVSCAAKHLPRFDRPMYVFDQGAKSFKSASGNKAVEDKVMDGAICFESEDFHEFTKTLLESCNDKFPLLDE